MNAKPQEDGETFKNTGLCGGEGEALAEPFRRFRFHGSPEDWPSRVFTALLRENIFIRRGADSGLKGSLRVNSRPFAVFFC